MSDENATPPEAGWYPDPENAADDRWWNGVSWSDHRRSRETSTGWAPVSGATPAERPNPYAAPAERSNPYAAAAPAPSVRPAPTPGAVPHSSVTPYAGATPYPTPPPYAANYAPRPTIQNRLALGGMITSLAALFFNWILFGLPGLVGGFVSIGGLVRANRLHDAGVTAGNGFGFAVTGIVVGFFGAFLFDLFYFSAVQPFQSFSP
jgi:hypothetical protein